MNRFAYIDEYKKPSSLVLIGSVYCNWNAEQARKWKTRDACISRMKIVASAYGETQMGANYFNDWTVENGMKWQHLPIFDENGIEHGSMRVSAKAYYRS